MQFDVRRNPGRAAELAPYLIELQDESRLGPVVVNLESERDRIIAAIDMLFTGI